MAAIKRKQNKRHNQRRVACNEMAKINGVMNRNGWHQPMKAASAEKWHGNNAK